MGVWEDACDCSARGGQMEPLDLVQVQYKLLTTEPPPSPGTQKQTTLVSLVFLLLRVPTSLRLGRFKGLWFSSNHFTKTLSLPLPLSQIG